MQISKFLAAFFIAIIFMSAPSALAQSAKDQAALAALAAVDLKHTPAKKLFGAKKLPLNMQARAIGSYAKGCLSGAKALPVTGPAWQAMRTSRNRNWAHPALVNLIEKLAKEAKQKRWLEWAAGGRHVTTPWRPHADRPCQPPDWPRRRRLVHPHAGSHHDRCRARNLHARSRW